MSTFVHLMKREFAEHRTGMLITPLVIAGLIALALTLGALVASNGLTIHLDPEELEQLRQEIGAEMTDGDVMTGLRLGLGGTMIAVSGLLFVTAAIVAIFTLLSALYDERNERTILFFKSMPVSDLSTVLSKLAAAALITPAIALGVAVGLQLFTLLVMSLFGSFNDLPIGAAVWTKAPYLTVWSSMILASILYVLWAAPLYAWCLTASAFAPRAPLLVAVVPILLVGTLEGILNRSSFLFGEVGQRLLGTRLAAGDWDGQIEMTFPGKVEMPRLTFADFAQNLTQIELWLGLLVAAGLVLAATEIRRRRSA